MRCKFPDCITKLSKTNKDKEFCYVHQRIIDGEELRLHKRTIVAACPVCRGKGFKTVPKKLLREIAKNYEVLMVGR
jgi:hypothetical protein